MLSFGLEIPGANDMGREQTHEFARQKYDWGRDLGHRLARALSSRRYKHYRPLVDFPDDDSLSLEGSLASEGHPPENVPSSDETQNKRGGLRQLWTANVLLTLLVHFLLAIHTSAFNAMVFVFLPTPRAPEGTRHGLFHFSGGLGLPSSRVGFATAIIGVIGLPLQILLYPRVQSRLGTIRCFRTFVPFSAIAYILMPYLVLVPRHSWALWPAFTVVVGLQVVSRTFSLPAPVILVNNCVTDPTILGTLHGIAQSVSSAARTLGPYMGGMGLGLGLKHNIIGAVWWALAVEAIVGWLLLWTIYEGKGIERKGPRGNHGRTR